jgi:hypothetical protein
VEIDSEEAVYAAGFKDTRGYYEDGAYIAAPLIGPVLPGRNYNDGDDSDYDYGGAEDWDGNEEWDGDDSEDYDQEEYLFHRLLTPLDAYTKSLLARFHAQRSILHSPPPAIVVQTLDFAKCLILPKNKHQHFKAWTNAVKNIDPSPIQLSTMNNETVIALIQSATRSMERDTNLTKRYSAWVWGLLVRLDERAMNGSDVSAVRELGLRAAWMRMGFIKELAEASKGMCGDVESEEDEEDEETKGVAQAEGSEEDGEIPEDEEVMEEAQRGRIKELDCGVKRRRNTSSPSPRPTKRNHSVSSSSPHNPFTPQRSANGHVIYSRDDADTTRDCDGSTFPKEAAECKTAGHVEVEDDASIQAAKRKLLEKFTQSANTDDGGDLHTEDVKLPDLNTVVTLDMIITIVGEVFGQRDLLEARELWEDR